MSARLEAVSTPSLVQQSSTPTTCNYWAYPLTDQHRQPHSHSTPIAHFAYSAVISGPVDPMPGFETTNTFNSRRLIATKASGDALHSNATSRATARCNALDRRGSRLVVFVPGIVRGMTLLGSKLRMWCVALIK
jgi:hypothetical protein